MGWGARWRHRARTLEGGLARRVLLVGARRAIARLPQPYLLHVGCGDVRLDGWVNLDLQPRAGVVDVVWDVRRGLPFGPNSCVRVFCEHFLEHLTPEQGLRFVGECRRVLQPAGVLRVAVPSLATVVEQYLDDDWRSRDWLRRPSLETVQTRAEMINICFRSWGHKWLYDREELHRRLKDAGFASIRDAERGKSEHPELRGLETRIESDLVCEATK